MEADAAELAFIGCPKENDELDAGAAVGLLVAPKAKLAGAFAFWSCC